MDDFGSLYAGMEDGELLALAEELDTLTDEARNALLAELHNRKLDQEARRLHQQRLAEQAIPSEPTVRLVTIATFNEPLSANLARTRLVSEGLECFVADEHMVRLDWPAAIALGYIKLQVRESDVERARKILQEIEERDGKEKGQVGTDDRE